MYAWLPAPLRGGARGRGSRPGQMLPGSVPGGPFRGSNPNSLKESNGFPKGKECSSFKDGGDTSGGGGAGRKDGHHGQPILTAPVGSEEKGRDEAWRSGHLLLGEEACGEPPRGSGFMSGQSPLVFQKGCHPTASPGLSVLGMPVEPPGRQEVELSVSPCGVLLAKWQRRHVTLDTPPEEASACHLQGRQSAAGPRGSALRKLLCEAGGSTAERVTRPRPPAPLSLLRPLSAGQVLHQRHPEVQGPRSAAPVRLHKPQVPGHQGHGVAAAAGMLPQTRPVLSRPGQHSGDGRDDPLQGPATARVSVSRGSGSGSGSGQGPVCRG